MSMHLLGSIIVPQVFTAAKIVYTVNMDDNDYTVNIDRQYHHGDLRAALLRTGMELIADRATDDLSLREIARSVGVSANAVYRHFPDKQALMRGIAAEGLSLLGKAQRAAADGLEGAQAFAATGKAYVRFAIKNPALFRLIFSTAGKALAEFDMRSDPGKMLQANALAATPDGGDTKALALKAWSLAHGFAMLVLDGQITFSHDILDSVFTN